MLAASAVPIAKIKSAALAALVAMALVGIAAVTTASPAPTRAPGSTSTATTAPGPIEIYDTMVLDNAHCILAIEGGDTHFCAGETRTFSVHVTCLPGYERAGGPQWFLDDAPIGTGEQIQIAPGPGAHVLIAACGSCEDRITVTADACPPDLPRLEAAFSTDSTEATVGILMEPNLGPIGPQTFPALRYLMRPFVLDVPPGYTGGVVYLEASGPIELFRRTGAPLAVPAILPAEALPDTFLANATAAGAAEIIASSVAPGGPRTPENTDEVRVRIVRSPGLAGRTCLAYPHFEFVQTFNDDGVVKCALDPSRYAERIGLPFDAYIVEHKTPIQWAQSNELQDVTGGAETGIVADGSIAANAIEVWTSGLDGGSEVGKAYDLVCDFGRDGHLDPGDLIDGLTYTGAGLYVVRDLSLPGPHGTLNMLYTGGTYLSQITYYPSDLEAMGQVPLVVISHGYGHNYTWYQYLQQHLASYGYIVVSHESNVNPGIESASTSTLLNTDFILANQQTIGGGVLNGHIDSHRIIWIGHSRGGEGVTRAYDRIYDHTYTPVNFGLADLVAVSAIAPCVHLTATEHDPHMANYHLIAGSSDGDVTGGADCPNCQFFRISEVARGNLQTTYIHGASHNDFNCCGVHDGQGPYLIGPDETQRIAKGYYLALAEWYAQDNQAAGEFFTRMYESLHPSGIAPNVTVVNTYKPAVGSAAYVIDDYQTHPELNMSSSGGMVTYDVSHLAEGHLNDASIYFAWDPADPMNGMTLDEGAPDYSLGAVFDWTVGESRFLEYEVPAGHRDLSGYVFLSLRACQGTRHTETVALDGPMAFTVSLRDGLGIVSPIRTDNYGFITKPYQRIGLGDGAGWQNEFATVRIPLISFTAEGSGIDLTNIEAVRLQFGAEYGSPRGRLGVDDIEVTRK